MINLKWFREQRQGLPDLLPYAIMLDSNIILCKNGSFLVGWRVQGIDAASSTYTELAVISARANEALRQLGTGWMLHFNACRSFSRAYPPPEMSLYPDKVTQMIDDERRTFFGQDYCFTTDTILLLTYKPSLTEAFFAKQAKVESIEDIYQDQFDYFKSMIMEVEDTLSSVLSMKLLGSYEEFDGNTNNIHSEILEHLQYCISSEMHPIRMPKIPVYLDSMLGAGDLHYDAGIPKIGEKSIAIVAIGGLPLESWPFMLSKFDSLPIPFRFCFRYIFMDQWDALQEIEKYRKGWQQSMYKILDKITSNPNPRLNHDAANMHNDAIEAETEVRSGLVSCGYLTPVVVLMHEDKKLLHEMAREIKRMFQSIGYASWIEKVNTYAAWLGSLPGIDYANIRRPLVNTMNLADLLPLSTVWTGVPHNPCPFYPENSRCLSILTTDGSTPFRFNIHENDLGHTIILGPTGSGKSTLLALIAAQFRCYQNNSIFVFDKGLSMYPLVKGAGGCHFDIGRGDLAFAPLQRIHESDEEFAYASEWIANLAVLRGMKIKPAHTNAIHLALTTLKNNPASMRSLTDFWHVLQNIELKEALRHYTRIGAMGHLLDAQDDNLQLSKFDVFEIETLMELGEGNVIPVLTYLFHRIENALKGQPALLILDEAWVMLGHELFRETLRGWFKTFRRRNCAVVLATQSISDATKSGIMDVIIESCPTKIFLANYAAEEEVSSALYRMAGLNERQIGIIRDMTPKRDYYIVQPSGRRKVQLALGPKTLAFIGSSDRESLARIKVLSEEYPDNWQDMWLKERIN